MKHLNAAANIMHHISHINREIYGNFSEHLGRCIYNGIYVGEDSPIPNICGIRQDIIDAFREIKLPVLRWPGGCFADEYHWKDGIGDKATRKKMINTNWGGVSEDNSFGTHEFMKLCELVGCEPYITGNVGSGSVEEMSEWIEYMTLEGGSPMSELRKKNGQDKPWKVKYFAVGNENWGCGGNMRPEYYADVYKRFSGFCKNYSGNSLYKVACGPSGDDYNWTDVMMKNIHPGLTKAIALHYYTVTDWGKKGLATVFDDKGYYHVISCANHIDELITRHSAIMDRYDPNCRIGLVVDEWGTWFDVEPDTNPAFLYQQNTMRDAIVAALSLNIFNKHSRRVTMANIAQIVNVLQTIILTEGDKLIKTPTYHVFNMYNEHQDSELVYSWCENETKGGSPAISESVSVSKDGAVNITLANCALDEDYEIDYNILGIKANECEAKILTTADHDPHAHNTFDEPENVTIKEYSAELTDSGVKVTVPRCSVVSICLK